MKYKVVLAEVSTTRSGKEKKDCVLTDEAGTSTKDVGVWQDFPGYAEIQAGSDIEGEIVVKGKYKSLYPPRSGGGNGGTKSPSPRSSGPSVVEERRHDAIRGFQADKETGIKTAAAMRDATLILTTIFKESLEKMPQDLRPAKIKELHRALVDWYLEEWDSVRKQLDNLPF